MTLEINNCIEILKKGKTILYPTDTSWAIGCDATNEEAVKKVIELKQIKNSEILITIVANQAMLERYVEYVPEVAYDIMDFAQKPTTIVYDSPKNFAQNVLANDGSVAIRVASDKFCQYLVNKFGKPLVAITVDLPDKSYLQTHDMIESQILKGVDYVVNLQKKKKSIVPSSIIKLSNNSEVKIIRS